MNNRLDHSGKNAISLFEDNFQRPATLMRASTGYFSFKGWNLLRKFLQCGEVRILIGFDENSEQIIRKKAVAIIMADLQRWHDAERREVIRAVVASMESKAFTVFHNDQIEDLDLRGGEKDHTKVYILDNDIVLAGSANLTYSGLRTNRENLTTILEPERQRTYIDGFESGWTSSNAYDITAEILARLKKWLELVDPYDIYLKSVATLMPPRKEYPVKPSYKHPNTYQEDVANQMERQLEQYNGCILIASTGLGKTIMATEVTLRLFRKELIDSLIVFAPVATHTDWRRTVSAANVPLQVFTRNLLDIPEAKGGGALEEMLIALDEADEKTVIIVDEAQYFANRYAQPKPGKKKKRERESYKRLMRVVQENGAYIILMTATPFVKRARDINNQLSLLPHTGNPVSMNRRGQLRLLLLDEDEVSTDWFVPDNSHFFESFIKLPVSTLITTAYVGKHYCKRTDEGEYLDFPDKRRWLPRVEHYRVRIPFAFEDEMDVIFKQGTLEHRTFKFRDRDFNLRTSRKTVTQRVITAWSSSPESLQRILEKASTDAWDETVPFNYPREEREAHLAPLIRKLKYSKPKDDLKLVALEGILHSAVDEARKVIIFVESLPTAGYLERNLRHRGWRVVSTIAYDKKEDTYKTKPKRKAQRILNHFAPIANADKIRNTDDVKASDILITTDAFGAGVNLQDASVVINYDLAWTADMIIQRAGRVMRFWDDPRTVKVYTFMPDASSGKGGPAVQKAIERVQRLQQRTGEAVKFSEYFFLTDETGTSTSFGDLSQVMIEPLGTITPDTVEKLREVSPMLDRRAELRHHTARLAQLNDDIISALEMPNITVPQLFMLIRVENRPVLLLYDIANKRLIPKRDDQILDFIHCKPDEPAALVDADLIEQQAEACIKLWCKEKKIDQDEVERICTLIIIQKGEVTLFDNGQILNLEK